VTWIQARVNATNRPSSWSWAITGHGSPFEQSVRLSSDDAEHQALIDRDFASSVTRSGTTRAQLLRTLVAVVGDRLASVLGDPSVDGVTVIAPPLAYFALRLPLELLGAGGRVLPVVRVVDGPRPVETPERDGRFVLVSSLVTEDPYLPLHLEASRLAQLAVAAGFDLDELFLALTQDDVLIRGRGASLVHIASHGDAAGLRVATRDPRDSASLSAEQLIESWRPHPPWLLMLNACYSTHDLEVTERFLPGSSTRIEELQHIHQFADGRTTGLSTMAIRLAAELPVGVVAWRGATDDAQARSFANGFYRRLFVDRLEVERAFAETLATSSYVDDGGVPVAQLVVSAHWQSAPPTTPSSPRSPNLLSASSRQAMNLFYKAIVGMSRGGPSTRRSVYFTGWDRKLESLTVQAISQVLAAQWPADETDRDRPQIERIGESPFESLVSIGPAEADNRLLIGIELDSVPDEVGIREIAAACPGLDAASFALVTAATCFVPALLCGLRQVNVPKLVARLAQVSNGRDQWFDQRLPRELADCLVDMLPSTSRHDVTEWSEQKWRALVELGPMAVDVYAVRCTLASDHWRVGTLLRALAEYQHAIGLSTDQLTEIVTAIANAGAAGPGVEAALGRPIEVLTLDLFTARRAWAECTATARMAHLRQAVNRSVAVREYHEILAATDPETLRYEATVAISCRAEAFGSLFRHLRPHLSDEEAADLLQRAGEAGVLDRDEDDSAHALWVAFDEAVWAGDNDRASSLLDRLGARDDVDDTQVAVTRLAHFGEGLAPLDRLSAADGLEERVLNSLAQSVDVEHEASMLLLLGQVRRAALVEDGRSRDGRDALTDTFRRLQQFASLPSQAAAGAAVVHSYIADGAGSEALALAGEVRRIADRLPVSSSRMEALAQLLRVDYVNQRDHRTRISLESLLAEFATWPVPRLTTAAEVLQACALVMASPGDFPPPVAVAMAGLATWFLPAMPFDLSDHTHPLAQSIADAARAATPDAVALAAADLAITYGRTLEKLGRSTSEYLSSLGPYHSAAVQLPSLDPVYRMIGYRLDYDALRERVDVGCPLSRHVWDWALSNGAPIEPVTRAVRPEPLDAGLTQGLRPLMSLLGGSVPDQIWRGIRLFEDTWLGDSRARIVLVGLMSGDLISDAPTLAGPVFALITRAPWPTIERTLFDGSLGTTGLLAACALIDHCWTLSAASSAYSDSDEEVLTELAHGAWTTNMRASIAGTRYAEAMLEAVFAALGETRALALLRSERARADGEPEFPTPEWLEWLLAESTEVFTAILAAALRQGDRSAAAEAGLRKIGAGSEETAALTAYRELVGWLSQDESRREQALSDLHAMAKLAATDGTPTEAAIAAWSEIGASAADLGDPELSYRAWRTLESSHASLDANGLLAVQFNRFQFAIGLRHHRDAVEVLKRNASTFGFSPAMHLVGANLDRWMDDETLAAEIRDVLLDAAGRPDPARPKFEDVLSSLLARLPSSDDWAPIVGVIRGEEP
jgi:hypothetical protein